VIDFRSISSSLVILRGAYSSCLHLYSSAENLTMRRSSSMATFSPQTLPLKSLSLLGACHLLMRC
jgi:hypothetical protein